MSERNFQCCMTILAALKYECFKKTPSVKETTKALIQNVSLERQLRRIQGL